MNIQLYTLKEAAVILKVSRGTVRDYVLKQKLGATIVGRFYRISEEQIQEFLRRNTIKAKED